MLFFAYWSGRGCLRSYGRQCGLQRRKLKVRDLGSIGPQKNFSLLIKTNEKNKDVIIDNEAL